MNLLIHFVATGFSDSKKQFMEVILTPYLKNSTEIQGVFVSARDITLLNQHQDDLEKATLVVENSPVVVFRIRADKAQSVEYVSKNIARGSFEETKLSEGFFVLTYQNNSSDIQIVEREIDSRFIQFHFCIKGSSEFIFNKGTYRLKIEEENSLLLYNPQRDLPIYFTYIPFKQIF